MHGVLKLKRYQPRGMLSKCSRAPNVMLESCSICPQSPSHLLPAILLAGAIALKQGIPPPPPPPCLIQNVAHSLFPPGWDGGMG